MSVGLTTKSPECSQVHKLGAPTRCRRIRACVFFLETRARSSVARTTRTPRTACRLEASSCALKLRALRPLGASRHVSVCSVVRCERAPGNDPQTHSALPLARRCVRSTRLEEPATSFAFLLPLPCERSQPITETTASSGGGPSAVKVVHRVNELINSYV